MRPHRFLEPSLCAMETEASLFGFPTPLWRSQPYS